MYGVASINLDKIRGRHIKRYLIVIVVLYLILLLVGQLLPERVVKNQLGIGEMVTGAKQYSNQDGSEARN